MVRKRFLFVVFFLVCLLGARFDVFAVGESKNTFIFEVTAADAPPPFCDEFYITGAVPQITVSADSSSAPVLQAQINKEINALITAKMNDGIAQRARSMSFSYDIKNDDTDSYVSSVVIYTRTNYRAYQKQEVFSVSFDAAKGSPVSLNDYFGPNGIKIINAYIYDMIRREPELYVLNFAGVAESTAFYVLNGSVSLLFNSYELIKGSPDIQTISIPANFVKNYVYVPDDLSAFARARVASLPLRGICEYFGYLVYWRGFGESVMISRDGVRTEITPGVNSYKKGNVNIVLESAPIVLNGVIYAPITFFEEVLGLSYYVNENTVTISEMARIAAAD